MAGLSQEPPDGAADAVGRRANRRDDGRAAAVPAEAPRGDAPGGEATDEPAAARPAGVRPWCAGAGDGLAQGAVGSLALRPAQGLCRAARARHSQRLHTVRAACLVAARGARNPQPADRRQHGLGPARCVPDPVSEHPGRTNDGDRLDLRIQPRTGSAGTGRTPPIPGLRAASRAPPQDRRRPAKRKLMSDESMEPETGPSENPELVERALRIIEALLFASAEPLAASELAQHLGEGADVDGLLARLAEHYSTRGVHLVQRADKWAFRTAPDFDFLLRREQTDNKPLSRAALETLAIIAYHQPATRAEVEEVTGVATGKGTLDLLMEAGWVKITDLPLTKNHPVTYGTTEAFLDHFGLESLGDLPGLEELKGAGLLSNRLPPNMQIPLPFDGPLREDEDPLDPDDTEGQDEPT